MNGLNPMYDTVTRRQHEQDMRQAAEFRLIQDARRRTCETGFLTRLFGRMRGIDAAAVECAPERNVRTAL